MIYFFFFDSGGLKPLIQLIIKAKIFISRNVNKVLNHTKRNRFGLKNR